MNVQSHSTVIRLGCVHCDRTDFDGVSEVPSTWREIFPCHEWCDAEAPMVRPTWETHRGVCPDCLAEYSRHDAPLSAEDKTNEVEPELRALYRVHPIIRQIINRDCHVGESNHTVVKHVISKLKGGYDGFRKMDQASRREFIEGCVLQHAYNRNEYVEVMSGFTKSLGKHECTAATLTGLEIVRLMRKHKVTIPQLAFWLGTSQKRVRAIREKGLTCNLAVRDWIQAITREDPGPIPEKYHVGHHSKEGECCFCGYPMYVGDDAYDYMGEMFCSISCARKSRGW
jgi:DNA-binding transcriptional regulator YiaG